MKKAGVILGSLIAIAAASAPAFAINTYKSVDFSCANLKALVQREGEVRLQYPPFGSTSVIYSNPDSCPGSVGDDSYEPTPMIVAAADTWFCSVGYTCEEGHHH